MLITGASSGIGRSTAFEFARACPSDLKLILSARRLEALRQIAAEIVEEVGDGVKIHTAQVDVSDRDEVQDFISTLPTTFSDIDVLVNNAWVLR